MPLDDNTKPREGQVDRQTAARLHLLGWKGHQPCWSEELAASTLLSRGVQLGQVTVKSLQLLSLLLKQEK